MWVVPAALILQAALIAQSVDFQAEGMKALDAKQYAAAVDLFTKAVAADPKDYSAHFNLGLAYSLMGNDAEAIPQYKTVLDLKPGVYQAELNLGISLLRTKDAAGAVPHLTAAVVERPKESRPAFNLGQAQLELGHFPEAAQAFSQALSIDESAAAEAGLGKALARQNHPSEAEPHYRKAIALDPGYKDALLELAAMYEDQHQPSEAIAIYREFPANPGAQERMGALLSESGKAADAIPALETAVAKSPTSANRVALAQAYFKNKQPEKAIPMAAQALAADPNDFDLRMFYARMLRDQRKFPEAAAEFAASAKLRPADVKPWNELAAVLIVSERYPEALAALDHVREMGAETSSHYYWRAVSYDHLHQLKEALANYNKFLESSQGKYPDEEFISRQRARILQHELNRK
jgi:tetratricopeptide (TPR) repeat protein